MDLGLPEISLIVIVRFFFVGANKIPDIMKGLGAGVREFRKAARGLRDEVEKEVKQVEGKDDPRK